ncbi:MAG TPA: hypothetical protein VEK32_05430, partial [Thermodesulfobacteriota bacterium]|nr:hypothetical protein [Thermodesulfobacteriota bacterium]
MKKIILLSVLLIFLIPLGPAFANDTDLYILTQLMQQVPPDTLILLDLSGSMSNYTTDLPTYTLYINPGTESHGVYQYQCGNTTIPYYWTNASPHTTACTINSTQVIYGDPTCAGPFYMTYNQTGTSASRTTCTQSKVAIAQRALFKLLDADNCSGTGTPDGIINSCDQAYLKIRMGYMRYYNCGSTSPEATGYPETNTSSYNSGCNTVIDPINTPYPQIYCNESTSCTPSGPATATSIETETASGGTPLAAALEEANYYLTYTKTLDNDSACRQKFVILITDGDDTYACKMNGSEGEKIQYKGRREVVAQARALANAGYYVFAVGFGSTMPSFEQNTLNWVAYYGNTKNTNETQSITTMYTIPYSGIYPSGVTQCMSSSQVMGPYTGTGAPYWGYTYYYANSPYTNTPGDSDPGQDAISGYAFIATSESDLNAAINNIRNFIIALIAQSTSYVAPVVPVSQYQSTSSENDMCLGMF